MPENEPQPDPQLPPHVANDPTADIARTTDGKVASVLQTDGKPGLPTEEDLKLVGPTFQNGKKIDPRDIKDPELRQEVLSAIMRVADQKKQQFANKATVSGEFGGEVDEEGNIRFGTALTDNFLPQFGLNPVLTSITPGSSSATLTFQGIENYTPPGREYQSHGNTPLTGPNAGNELVTITTQKSAMIIGTMIYGTAHHAAYDAITGLNGCTQSLTLNDGAIWAGKGGTRKLSTKNQGNNNSLEDDFEMVLNAGFTYTAGTGGNTNA